LYIYNSPFWELFVKSSIESAKQLINSEFVDANLTAIFLLKMVC
jgi:hypothetical protein